MAEKKPDLVVWSEETGIELGVKGFYFYFKLYAYR